MVFNPPVGAKPVSRPQSGQAQAVTPHLELTEVQLSDYRRRADKLATRSSTSPLDQHERIPFSQARLDPSRVLDAQSAPQDIQPVAINLHPDVESAEAAPAGVPIQVAEDTPTLSVIAQLGQLIDPELAQLADAAFQEQQLVGGAV